VLYEVALVALEWRAGLASNAPFVPFNIVAASSSVN
jgi:hypothetical protein